MAAHPLRVAFTVRTPQRAALGLRRYQADALAGVPPIMEESRERVYASAYPNVPVKSGKMQRTLRRESDPDGMGYAVGWNAVLDYPAGGPRYTYATVPAGTVTVPAGFYPGFVIFGTRFMAGRDPITPALETERPVLLQELRSHFSRAGKR